MKTWLRAYVSILSLCFPSLVLIANGPASLFAQDQSGTVIAGLLQSYGEPSAQSDTLNTLSHGTVVRITWTLTNDEGSWCSVSSAESLAKLGFVHCDGLQRATPVNTASLAGGPPICRGYRRAD